MPIVNEANAAQQRALYGAPLGDLCHAVMEAFAMTQGRLASVLGLSAPMLSQLMSAQRVKIANPVVLHRLQSLLELRDEAAHLSADEVAARVEQVRGEAVTITTEVQRPQAGLGRALREVASAEELRAAAVAVPGTALARLLFDAADA